MILLPVLPCHAITFYFANAIYLLPYTGTGSGIQRALSEDNRLTFSNNESLHEFVITIARNLNTDSDTFSGDSDTKEQDLDTDSDTFSGNSDTKEQDLDTDSDTFSSDSDTKEQDLDTDSDTFSGNSDTKEQDLDTDSDTFSSDSDTKNQIKLNKKQKDVINFCNIPRSSKEILERVV